MTYHRGCSFSLCWACAAVLPRAYARDLGVAGQWSFDQRREDADEKRWAFASVCDLSGDRMTQCNRHGWMFGLISLFLFKPFWGVTSVSHIFMWVDNSLDNRNWLSKLVYSVRAELGWHCKVCINMLGVTEQILDSGFFGRKMQHEAVAQVCWF